MLSGGDGVGIMNRMNRSIARPGFQGSSPSAMLNSGRELSSSTEATPSQVNMHSGVGSALRNSMLRPREAPNMMRPVQNPENQRQMMVPEFQMQATKGNSQGVPPFGRLSSAFSNQTSPPPVHTYPIHQQQRQHQISTPHSHVVSNSPHPHLQAPSKQHQAYTFHLPKEKQLQQQRLLQQHQRFATSTALIPHAQPTQMFRSAQNLYSKVV